MAENYIIIKGKNFSKGNLQGFNPSFTPLVIDGGEGRGYAEYNFVIDKEGYYKLYSVYACEESRPTEIYIDGELERKNGLCKRTKGWTIKNTILDKEAEVYLKPGWHCLKIKREGFIPHIKEFIFVIKDKLTDGCFAKDGTASLKDNVSVLPGRSIVPPEIKDIILSEDNRTIYPELIRYSEYEKINVIDRDVPLQKFSAGENYIYFYGENSETHRWGTNFDEKDFFRQIEKFKYFVNNNMDYKVVIGVRRTNFFKLKAIFNLVIEMQKRRFVVSPPTFSLKPLRDIKRRFYEYLDRLNAAVHSGNIKFAIVDDNLDKLLTIIEYKANEKLFDENGMLRALGPVCKDVFTGPSYILLNLCGFCNTDCIYCRKFSSLLDLKYRKKALEGKQLMDFDAVKNLLEEAKNMKTDTILVVGEGEPTVYPHFKETVKLIREAGFNFHLSTNGMLLNKYEKDLLAGGCASITVSMSFASKETFAKLRPMTDPKWADIIESNVKRLSRLKKVNNLKTPKILALHAIYKHNYKEIVSMAVKAKELGADSIWYQLVHLEDFSYHKLKLDDLEMEEIKKLLAQARRICRNKSIGFDSFIDFELEHYNPEKADWSAAGLLKQGCFVGWHFAYIGMKDVISFCCGEKVVGLLKNKSFRECWYSDVYRRYRNDAIVMHKENPVDLYGKPLYDKFCNSCDNHDQNITMIKLLKKHNLFDFVER